MQKLDDRSRSLIPLEPDGTPICVTELSLRPTASRSRPTRWLSCIATWSV